ncbi:MAG TPA: Pre-mRNA processing ribonucleoprotein [Methanothermococcus okinawensis]|uniref:Pre-mRNA processing ribonucleoprotein n=1 Tax=Methanothermococcus okinawensis TaxID=155863 RepID=A0A833E5J6_9EURY|nr:Pre-mRNA processing ribonucleoprotein [Methanothermococcus okinawensis]HIP90699.1 Pre-mRNA processing ribonucleoprotein [Methanothermococcus okinawensis]
MYYLIFTTYGAFLLEHSEDLSLESIKHYKIFPEEEIPEIMYQLRRGNFQIVDKLKEEWNLRDDGEVIVEYLEEEPTPPGRFIRGHIYTLGKRYRVFNSYEEFIEKTNLWATELTKLLMKEASERKDKLIIQTVSALDDLDETLNLFSERLREWYSLYFPEMDKIIKKHELYARLVSQCLKRENFTRTRLKEFLPSKTAKILSKAAKNSMGAELSERDLSIIKEFADEILSLYNLRNKLLEYLEELMEETAPNLTKLAGPSLGARLISLTGGLERLSKLPASTIQVIGAEKALFAHLRLGADPPKHGVIFQHPLIQGSPWWIRGKVARALACKLAIGIRADVFGNYIADELLEALNKRVEEIKRKYPEPRKKPSRKRMEKSKRKKGGKKKKKVKKGKKIIGKTSSKW